jgi:hypothetical protein
MSKSAARLDKGMDNLRGRVLGMVESWGLPDKQERGIKSTFKSLTYDLQADLQNDIREDIGDAHGNG